MVRRLLRAQCMIDDRDLEVFGEKEAIVCVQCVKIPINK